MSDQEVVIDKLSCERAGALAAYDLSDQQIMDTLMLDADQLGLAKTTPEYQKALSEKLYERTSNAIDVTEGWDTVEEMAIAKVVNALAYSNDPKYALTAAHIASRAPRRARPKTARTLSTGQAGTVVHLNLNQRFVTQAAENGVVIDHAKQQQMRQLPHKRVDMPTAQQVKNLLETAQPLLNRIKEVRVADMMDQMGFGDIKTE